MAGEPEGVDVLVVDDDPRILATFRRTAKDLPLRMRYATTATEAMRMVEESPPEVLICDYRLPDLDGLTVLERVGVKYPHVKRILHTGEAVMRTAIDLEVPVLGKPCSHDALRELLESFTRPRL